MITTIFKIKLTCAVMCLSLYSGQSNHEISRNDLQASIGLLESDKSLMKSIIKAFGKNTNYFVIYPYFKHSNYNMFRYEPMWWEIIGEKRSGLTELDSNLVSKLEDSDIPNAGKQYLPKQTNAVIQFSKPYKNSFSMKISGVYSEELHNPDICAQNMKQFIVFVYKSDSGCKIMWKKITRGPITMLYW